MKKILLAVGFWGFVLFATFAVFVLISILPGTDSRNPSTQNMSPGQYFNSFIEDQSQDIKIQNYADLHFKKAE